MYLCTSESSAPPHVQYGRTSTTTSLPLHTDHNSLSYNLPEHCSSSCHPLIPASSCYTEDPADTRLCHPHSWPAAPWCSLFWSLLYNIEFLAQQQGACKECKTPGSTLSNLYTRPHFQVTCACMEKEHWVEPPLQGQTAAICSPHHTPHFQILL